MRLKARTDKGHKAIVQALRKVGCQVSDTSRVGKGFPDLVVRVPWGATHWRAMVGKQPIGWLLLMEVKEATGKLTEDQQEFIAEWPETLVVHSVEEALKAVGVGW